ncbi:MAG TPA: hypothetical protein VI007_08170, partial [bacterium]
MAPVTLLTRGLGRSPALESPGDRGMEGVRLADGIVAGRTRHGREARLVGKVLRSGEVGVAIDARESSLTVHG